MARYPSCFTIWVLRQAHKNPTFHFRNISISTKDQFNSSIDKQESFTQAAKDVSKYLRSRPRWENSLVSEFSGVDFSDTSLLYELVKQQSNVMLKVRFFYWVCGQFGLPSDDKLFELIFDCLVESKAANAALRFLEFTKFDPGLGSLELFACCLFENGLIGDGVGVFDELVERGSVPKLETWNLGLNGAIRVGRNDVVWKLYGDMMSCGVEPDVETVTCLILALCSEDKLSEGYDLFRQCLNDGNVPRNVAFSKLISGFCERRKYYGVSALLHAMIVNNRPPSINIYHEIIYWLCRRYKVRVGYRIFNDLKDRGYVPNNAMYTTMIDGLCKINGLGDARKLLREMIEKGMKPCEQTYTVIISGLFQAGDIDEAQELYKELLDRGYKNTTMSYNTMITGLCMNGKIEEACDLFKQMLYDCGFVKNTCNFMIKGFCKEGKLVEGMKFLYNLLDQGFQPPPASYTHLIEKLCEAGELEEAKGLWEDMQDKGVMLSACTHNSITKGLSVVENFEDANSKSSPE